MFGAGLDGVDPAPLALVEVGGRQQIADRENSGQRRADLMRKRGQRRLDDAGSRGGSTRAARLAGGKRGKRASSLPAAFSAAAWCAVSAISTP